MKKFLIYGAVAFTLSACSNSAKTSYTVKGDIQGLPDSTVLLLSPLAHSETEPIAEAMVIGGKFEFTGTADEPKAVVLHVKDHYGATRFMLENADIVIKGTAEGTESGDGKNYYNFDGVTVSGSAMTDLFHEKMAGRYRIDSLFSAYQDEYSGFSSQLYKARSEGNTAVYDSLMATDTYKAMREREKGLFAALDSNYSATIAANSNDFWGPLLMIAQTSYLSAQNRDDYEALGDSAKNSYYGRLVYDELYPVGRPGDKMPEFEATTLDGTKTTLAALCKDKKYIILDFWASWCGPCRREIPNLKEIYGKNASKGFDIVSISIDKEENPWLNAVKNEDLKWTNIRDTDHSIADKYKVTAVPTMYVVDSEGRLVAENLRGEELAKKVDELMAE